jgi:hypothetical protein
LSDAIGFKVNRIALLLRLDAIAKLVILYTMPALRNWAALNIRSPKSPAELVAALKPIAALDAAR